MAWTHALLTGLLLACVFTQETAVIRLFSFDGETNIEGKLQPVLSLCTDIPAEADFLLSLSPPCLETPSNMRLFLVSRQAAGLLDLELVQVTASLRPRLGELPVWEITLPAAISLGNLHRIALGVETQSLACPSPAPTLQMLISTGFAWDCVSPSSCPSLCAPSRFLSRGTDCVAQDSSDYDSSYYEENGCQTETESVSKSSAAVAVVAVITVLGWYWLHSVCFSVVICIVGCLMCIRRRSIAMIVQPQPPLFGDVGEPDLWAYPVAFPSPSLLPVVHYEPALSQFHETVCSICMQE